MLDPDPDPEIEDPDLLVRTFYNFVSATYYSVSIMNTWYQKKQIHYGTWMHPAMKLHHLIDFVVMAFSQWMYCLDVQVMRGANCWTDHGAKLRLLLPQSSGA